MYKAALMKNWEKTQLPAQLEKIKPLQ